MIEYKFATDIIENLESVLSDAIINNIFLPAAGIVYGNVLKIHSGKWLVMRTQKGKKYFEFSFSIKPLYEINLTEPIKAELKQLDEAPKKAIGTTSLNIENFEVKSIQFENRKIELDEKVVETISNLQLLSKDERCIKIDFDTESPGGFVIEVIE